MSVYHPRKFLNALSPREIMAQVIQHPSLHIIVLNRYRFNEQHSCLELTHLIETLNGKPRELVRELSHHVWDEARHASWLTDLLYDLGEDIGTPPAISYINEFDRLLDKRADDLLGNPEDMVISALAAINVTEKRACQLFSAHITALKAAPATDENIKIRETLEKILPEEASHIRWGNRWLATMAKQSPEKAAKINAAKRKYTRIEQAAFDTGLDITLGAELRRLSDLFDVANTLPVWERPQYVLERLPETLIAPDLQKTRLMAIQRSWNENPQTLVDHLIPMFLKGVGAAS